MDEAYITVTCEGGQLEIAQYEEDGCTGTPVNMTITDFSSIGPGGKGADDIDGTPEPKGADDLDGTPEPKEAKGTDDIDGTPEPKGADDLDGTPEPKEAKGADEEEGIWDEFETMWSTDMPDS